MQFTQKSYYLPKGFTLIELLVVVLIIGILAAVAVPQYQKAVAKSRATEAFMMLKTIEQAQEVYYLTHQEYTDNLNNLDISIPADQIGAKWWAKDDTRPNTYIYSCSTTGSCAALAANRDTLPTLQTIFINANSEIGTGLFCVSKAKDNLAAQICKAMSIDQIDMQGEEAIGATYRLQ